MIQVILKALAYFGIVFSVGFVLGVIRVLLLVPQLGQRWSELLEIPLMLVVIVITSLKLFRGSCLQRSAVRLIASGVLALTFLLASELALVVFINGETIPQFIAGRDPLSGTAYLISLAIFAAMPWLVSSANLQHFAKRETVGYESDDP